MLDPIQNNSYFFWHLIFILDDQFLQFRFSYQDKISYQIYCPLHIVLFIIHKIVFAPQECFLFCPAAVAIFIF